MQECNCLSKIVFTSTNSMRGGLRAELREILILQKKSLENVRKKIRVKWERIMDGLNAGEDSSPSWNMIVTMSFPICRFLSTWKKKRKRKKEKKKTQKKEATDSDLQDISKYLSVLRILAILWQNNKAIFLNCHQKNYSQYDWGQHKIIT